MIERLRSKAPKVLGLHFPPPMNRVVVEPFLPLDETSHERGVASRDILVSSARSDQVRDEQKGHDLWMQCLQEIPPDHWVIRLLRKRDLSADDVINDVHFQELQVPYNGVSVYDIDYYCISDSPTTDGGGDHETKMTTFQLRQCYSAWHHVVAVLQQSGVLSKRQAQTPYGIAFPVSEINRLGGKVLRRVRSTELGSHGLIVVPNSTQQKIQEITEAIRRYPILHMRPQQ